MGLWDNISNIFSGGGRNEINRGYNEANRYLDPYRRGGMEDYNSMRKDATQWGTNLDRFNNAGDWMYGHINESPNQFYDTLMKGYSESPEAKYEQEQALRASQNAGSASGMAGSGAFYKGIQQNAADISNRDRDRYFGNVMGANNAQMGYMQNLQNQQAQRRAMMQYLTQLGYGGATGMADNAINRGTARANIDRQSIMDIMSMMGMGAGAMGGKGGASGMADGGDIPEYALKAIMAGGM